MRKIFYFVIITIFIFLTLFSYQITPSSKDVTIYRNIRVASEDIIITQNKGGMSKKAARILVNKMNKAIEKKGKVVVCFATGGTPTGLYKLLRTKYKDRVNWEKVITFNLDEYVGLSGNHSQSYRYYMDKHLFNHLPIPKENINFLNGKAKNFQKECKQYEEKINKVGGIDITILGIGRNGHIAFNEPGSNFNSKTRKIKLKEGTIQDNSRFFEDKEKVPRYALTMGINTINSKSGEILLLASGKKKADAIKNSIKKPVTPKTPASILQNHPNVHYIIDKKAESQLYTEPKDNFQ